MKTHLARNSLLGITLGLTPIASATVYDINKLIVERMQASGQLSSLYKVKTGRDMPPGTVATAIFEGEIGGKGLRWQTAGLPPQAPMVLSQSRVTNCSSREVQRTLTIDKHTTNMTTMSNTDTIDSGKELTVSLSYSSPWGVSASASATVRQSVSASKTQGAAVYENVGWNDTLQVPVEGGTAVKVQFVVTEQKLTNVPYTADLLVSGPMSIVFRGGPEGFRWVERVGTQLPANLVRLSSQGTTPIYACRVKSGDAYILGKSAGDICYFTTGQMIPMTTEMLGNKSNLFEMLVGAQDALTWGTPYAEDAYDADGKKAKICLTRKGTDMRIPGYVRDGKCWGEWSSRGYVTADYEVLRTPKAGGVSANILVQDWLDEEKRTFNLRGTFTGTNALYGDFRIGPSRPAPTADCQLIEEEEQGAATVKLKKGAPPGGATASAAASRIGGPTKISHPSSGPTAEETPEPAYPASAVRKKVTPQITRVSAPR